MSKRTNKPAPVDTMVEQAEAATKERKRIAKELRLERKAAKKALLRGSSSNRSYTTKIPGATIAVRWINGVQQCSIQYDTSGGKEVETEAEEPAVKLPQMTMTWKKLRAEVLAGNSVYTRSGKKIPCTKRAEIIPNKEVKVTVENVGKLKIYRQV